MRHDMSVTVEVIRTARETVSLTSNVERDKQNTFEVAVTLLHGVEHLANMGTK